MRLSYPLLLLRHQYLLAFSEDRVDGLRRAGIQAEAAAFQTAGRVEFERRGGKPGAGRADRHADGLVRAAVGMAD